MNNKAQLDTGYSSAEDSIGAITLLIFATIMAVSLLFLASNTMGKNLSADEKTKDFFTIQAARNCFLHKENGRVYYQTINPELITITKLEECLPNKFVGVALFNNEGKLISSAGSNINTQGLGYDEYFRVNIPNSNKIHTLAVMIS